MNRINKHRKKKWELDFLNLMMENKVAKTVSASSKTSNYSHLKEGLLRINKIDFHDFDASIEIEEIAPVLTANLKGNKVEFVLLGKYGFCAYQLEKMNMLNFVSSMIQNELTFDMALLDVSTKKAILWCEDENAVNYKMALME